MPLLPLYSLVDTCFIQLITSGSKGIKQEVYNLLPLNPVLCIKMIQCNIMKDMIQII